MIKATRSLRRSIDGKPTLSCVLNQQDDLEFEYWMSDRPYHKELRATMKVWEKIVKVMSERLKETDENR